MRNALRASALLATIAGIGGLDMARGLPPTPRKGSNRDYKPKNYALAQEIAAHNAAVDRAKAEKRARKAAKR